MTKWINGKTFIVTGASSGFGRDISAILLSRYHAKVIGIARNEQKMKEFAESLSENIKGNFKYKIFDTSVLQNWQDFKTWLIKKRICPDILINNAGIIHPFSHFSKLNISEYENIMQVNFFSAVYSVKTLYDLLLKSGTPGILNVSSSAALCPVVGTSAYSASKSALKTFTECLREETKGKCYVGLVCPGFSVTGLFRGQEDKVNNKLVKSASTKCEVVAEKMVKAIIYKKRRAVIGKGAKVMDWFYRCFPRSSLGVIKGVLKASRVSLFDNVFYFDEEHPKKPRKTLRD